MTDSADIKSAGQALDQAVDSLEQALSPILSRLNALEGQAKDTDAFREDRTKLAAELDRVSADAQAQAEHFQSRAAEFDRLAAQTEAELEQAIGLFGQVVNG